MARPNSLPSPEKLAEGKPHGTRIKYIGGCKCLQCRAANSRYECQRAQKRRAGLDNGLTSAKEAQLHIRKLSKKGIGKRTVWKASGVALSIIAKIRSGEKTRIRKDTERKILAVRLSAARPKTLLSAKPAWKMIKTLCKEGFTKKEIAARLGYKAPALQIKKDRITALNAAKISRFYSTIMAA